MVGSQVTKLKVAAASSQPLIASTKKSLADLAEAIMAPTDLTMNCSLMAAEDCQALLSATVEQTPATPGEATQLVRTLMGQYRKTDFNDPDIFATALAANFADFPASIGRQVTDPTKGLAPTLKFPPSIAEVRGALSSALARRRGIAYRARWMIDERKRREEEAQRAAEMTPEYRAATLAKVQALLKPKKMEDEPLSPSKTEGA